MNIFARSRQLLAWFFVEFLPFLLGLSVSIFNRVIVPSILGLAAWAAGLPPQIQNIFAPDKQQIAREFYAAVLIAGGILVIYSAISDGWQTFKSKRELTSVLNLPTLSRSIETVNDLSYALAVLRPTQAINAAQLTALLQSIVTGAAQTTGFQAAFISVLEPANHTYRTLAAYYNWAWAGQRPTSGQADPLAFAFQGGTFVAFRNNQIGLGVTVFRQGQPWGILHIERAAVTPTIDEFGFKLELRVLKIMANLTSYLLDKRDLSERLSNLGQSLP